MKILRIFFYPFGSRMIERVSRVIATRGAFFGMAPYRAKRTAFIGRIQGTVLNAPHNTDYTCLDALTTKQLRAMAQFHTNGQASRWDVVRYWKIWRDHEDSPLDLAGSVTVGSEPSDQIVASVSL